MSMCHSKSAQLSLLGWREHENKGPEQKGQPWGERRAAPSHKEGKEALWSGRGTPAWERNAGRGAEAGQETAHRSEEEARWPKEERLQNDDPLKEP